MRELLIVWAGRHRRDDWDGLCQRYRRRIVHHVPVREIVVKVQPRGGGRERRRAEGEALLAALPDPCWTIALDRLGRMRDSEQLAGHLEQLRADWPHPIAFLLGSDLGLDGALLEQVRECLSLGPMTLPHELARLMLFEQLYRAVTVVRGIPYHK